MPKVRYSKIRKLPAFGRMSLTKSQERELDRLWSIAVKSIAGNKCEYCKSTSHLQAHHAIGRRNKTLRHIVSNGFSLCAKHHMWAEQNGIAFARWALTKRGEEWWNHLEAKAMELKVWKEYSVIKKYLEEFIK